MHRVTWDLRWRGLEREPREYPIAAIPGDTPAEPRGPWALPGTYTVRLTAGDATETAPLVVRMDPRVTIAPAALEEQFTLSSRLAEAATALTATLAARGAQQSGEREGDEGNGDAALARVRSLNRRVLQAYAALQSVDAEPTTATRRAAEHALAEFAAMK